MNRPQAEKGDICPFHRKDVSKVCHTCPMFVNVKGKDPQSEIIHDRWACALAWGPTLSLEVAQQVRQHNATTEQLRDEVRTFGAIGAQQTQTFLHMMNNAQERITKS